MKLLALIRFSRHFFFFLLLMVINVPISGGGYFRGDSDEIALSEPPIETPQETPQESNEIPSEELSISENIAKDEKLSTLAKALQAAI